MWDIQGMICWNLKQPNFSGCFIWMIPNLYHGKMVGTHHVPSIQKSLFAVPGCTCFFYGYFMFSTNFKVPQEDSMGLYGMVESRAKEG